MSRTPKGFTLIELLVVIAIIALLSSVVLASLNASRVKAADTERIAAAKQIQAALELYFLDRGYYPAFTYSITAGIYGDCGYQNGWCDLETALAPYIKELPRDTASTVWSSGNQFRYLYKRNSAYPQMYGLGVVLDGSSNVASGDGGYVAQVYELGALPQYCKDKYAGAAGLWYNWNSALICAGGN